MPSLQPLALTDSEITTVMSTARVLPVADRDDFLRQVATVLATQPTLGDGIVARVCRELQSRFWRPPEPPTCGLAASGRRMGLRCTPSPPSNRCAHVQSRTGRDWLLRRVKD